MDVQKHRSTITINLRNQNHVSIRMSVFHIYTTKKDWCAVTTWAVQDGLFSNCFRNSGSGIHEGAMHIQDMIKFNVQQTEHL